MKLDWPVIILCAVGISLLLTALLIPQILHVSMVKRLFDRPNNRKVHSGAVPRLGGFAFLPVIVMTLGLTLLMPAAYTQGDSIVESRIFVASLPDILVMLAAMTVMFLTGLYDDLLGLKYGMKFLAQLVCAVMLVEAGLNITEYDCLFGISHTTLAMGKIISGVLIVYIINGLNLIDGIDGLASGICTIGMAFFGWVLAVEGQFIFSLLSWTGAATTAIFWIFNVWGSRKRHTKIFMGDIGSLSIGLLFAFLVIVVARVPRQDSAWLESPIVLALSPIVLPLFDVIRVFCVRIAHRKSPFLPDKRHIHHLMLAAGMSMKGAMFLLLFVQTGLLILNVCLAKYWEINWIMILDIGVYALMVISMAFMNKLKMNNKFNIR